MDTPETMCSLSRPSITRRPRARLRCSPRRVDESRPEGLARSRDEEANSEISSPGEDSRQLRVAGKYDRRTRFVVRFVHFDFWRAEERSARWLKTAQHQ